MSMKSATGQKFEWWWIGLLTLAAVAMVVAVLINQNSGNDSASKMVGSMMIDNGDEKINWNKLPTKEIALTDSLTIEESGTYHLTGKIEDGLVRIDPGATGVVKIILDNVSITNSDGPAIACMAGDDLVIELLGANTLTDGETYSAEFDEDVTGAIYSKADLTLAGNGSLELNANYLDGIIAKDDLKFKGGIYNIVAVDDGIRGKDSVYVLGGDFTIVAGADAIKSTNEFDVGKGFVLIENGDFELEAGAKGVKAISTVLINGGDFKISAVDDAVHSNNYVGIAGGDFEITTADDAVHADRELIVDGGRINVVKSYEGLEAQVVTINGGKISVLATDDGINAGGGSDTTTTGPNKDPFKADADAAVVFNGGEIYVNADGDGIDSNGTVYFNGGKVAVDGPADNGNGALDAGGGVIMNGGEMIAVGASGMALAPSGNSSAPSMSVFIANFQSAGTLIEIKNSAGATVMSHTAAKNFNHIAAGSSKFILGETYEIYLNNEKVVEVTLSSVTTTAGNYNIEQPTGPMPQPAGPPSRR